MTTRPSNSTPRCASKIMKPGVQTKTRSQMLAAAPVTTAERRKQPKGPSVDEWTNEEILRDWDFPGGSVVENPPANAGDTGSIPCLGISHIPQGS